MTDYTQTIKKVKSSVPLVFKHTGNKDVNGQPIYFPAGSGFVFKQKGTLLTCNHITPGALKYKLKFPDSEVLIEATLKNSVPDHDLAVLEFSDETREPLQPAKTDAIDEGMPVLFCGYPLTYTLMRFMSHQGIISAVTPDALGNKWYLVDGSNNKGNSGGPLLTKKGEVIGVMSMKYMDDPQQVLGKLTTLPAGAISVHGQDLMTIYQQLVYNIQLGIGAAIPIEYAKI